MTTSTRIRVGLHHLRCLIRMALMGTPNPFSPVLVPLSLKVEILLQYHLLEALLNYYRGPH
jgi:hypothetical protein